MRLTTNRSNWSGEEITVEVDRENLSWEQYGYRFHLERVDVAEDMQDAIGPYYYEIHGNEWKYPLGTIRVFDGGADAANGDIQREAKDPIEAAVKLLCNIL